MTQELLVEDIPQQQNKKVAIFVGRCNPPHLGHYKVIDAMAKKIRATNVNNSASQKLETTPIIVIVSGKKTGLDKSKNPLDFDDIVKVMRASGKIDNKAIFISAGSAFDAFVKAREAGYEPILVFGGSDRGSADDAPYKDMLDTYFTTPGGHKIKHTYVALHRNDASELDASSQETLLRMIEKDGEVDTETVSGTLVRKAAAMGLENAFAALMGLSGKQDIAQIMYKRVKRGVSN